jgi:uncharacterized protein (TIGR02391 family)
MTTLSQSQIEAIAAALGHSSIGLTGGEIGHLLIQARMVDPGAGITKKVRLHNAFVASQNQRQDRIGVLAFIRKAMKPERFLKDRARYEPLRAELNAALAFVGLVCDEAGKLREVDAVSTLPEAERRARELRSDLEARRVHPDVLRFCRSELLVDNYFHATLEAVKSIASKLRTLTGLDDDGATLVDRVFGGDVPMLAINPQATKSERDEQKGFGNLLKGVFGMFRNPTAHEARIHWAMTREDAEDLLTLASLIHRRIDAAHRPPRV